MEYYCSKDKQVGIFSNECFLYHYYLVCLRDDWDSILCSFAKYLIDCRSHSRSSSWDWRSILTMQSSFFATSTIYHIWTRKIIPEFSLRRCCRLEGKALTHSKGESLIQIECRNYYLRLCEVMLTLGCHKMRLRKFQWFSFLKHPSGEVLGNLDSISVLRICCRGFEFRGQDREEESQSHRGEDGFFRHDPSGR